MIALIVNITAENENCECAQSRAPGALFAKATCGWVGEGNDIAQAGALKKLINLSSRGLGSCRCF